MEQLRKALNYLERPDDDAVLEKFNAYMNGVLEWNKVINLTSIIVASDFVQKHFIDSLLCVDFPEFRGATTIIDIGTGAGFPGIPLALVAPDKHFVLVDSLKKRLNIIDELCDNIGISNIETVHGRADDLGRNRRHREKYDLCVSRAVAHLSVLSEYCLPFVKRGGFFLSYKGPGAEKELLESGNAIGKLGGKICGISKVEMDGFDLEHNIVKIEKTMGISTKYPRKAGTPSKDPLK